MEMATQIKVVITVDLSTKVTETFTLSHIDLEEDPKPITQSPMKDNDVSNTTPMKVDTNPRKRKEPSTPEKPVTTIIVTPIRNLRPQKHQGISGTLKKTTKERKHKLRSYNEYIYNSL